MGWLSGRSGKRQADTVDNGDHCDRCGLTVPIADDGRCRLGHRVGTPLDRLPPGSLTEDGYDVFGPSPVPAPSGPAGEDGWYKQDVLEPVTAAGGGLPALDDLAFEPPADTLPAARLLAEADQGDLLGFGTVAPPAPRQADTPPPHKLAEARPATHPYDDLLAWDDFDAAGTAGPGEASDDDESLESLWGRSG